MWKRWKTGPEGNDEGHHRKERVMNADSRCVICCQSARSGITVSQKLRCDVVQEPFKTCSRCTRLRLSCKIENNFKRVGKRSRNAEMEREIMELRKRVAQQSSPTSNLSPDSGNNQHQGAAFTQLPQTSNNMLWRGSEEAVASLLDLKSGLNDHSNLLRNQKSQTQLLKTIEDVNVPLARVSELFNL